MKTWTLVFRKSDKDNFEQIRNGSKSIETRANSIKYEPIKAGDMLIFSCDGEKLLKKISRRYHWKSIDEMVKELPFKRIMPNIESVEEMKKVYASYPNYTEKIKEHGLLGFELE